jgi:hypothetical protein
MSIVCERYLRTILVAQCDKNTCICVCKLLAIWLSIQENDKCIDVHEIKCT